MNCLDAEELADAVLGLTEDQVNDAPDYDALLDDKFGVDLETFASIADALLPFTLPARTAITGELYKGFAKDGASPRLEPLVRAECSNILSSFDDISGLAEYLLDHAVHRDDEERRWILRPGLTNSAGNGPRIKITVTVERL
jgi:hypothetical protein